MCVHTLCMYANEKIVKSVLCISGERLVFRDIQVFQLQRSTDIYQRKPEILCMETGCD